MYIEPQAEQASDFCPFPIVCLSVHLCVSSIYYNCRAVLCSTQTLHSLPYTYTYKLSYVNQTSDIPNQPAIKRSHPHPPTAQIRHQLSSFQQFITFLFLPLPLIPLLEFRYSVEKYSHRWRSSMFIWSIAASALPVLVTSDTKRCSRLCSVSAWNLFWWALRLPSWVKALPEQASRWHW